MNPLLFAATRYSRPDRTPPRRTVRRLAATLRRRRR
jgi:hypothetical protein